MTTTARTTAEADARVRSWASLDADQRAALLADANLRRFDSGGALMTLRGVDRWFPSAPDALDELAASASS